MLSNIHHGQRALAAFFEAHWSDAEFQGDRYHALVAPITRWRPSFTTSATAWAWSWTRPSTSGLAANANGRRAGTCAAECRGATSSSTNGVRDAEDMVLRDRNHPSVIMWSIGNEPIIRTTLHTSARHPRRQAEHALGRPARYRSSCLLAAVKQLDGHGPSPWRWPISMPLTPPASPTCST